MVGILVGRKVGWFVGAWLASCGFVSKAFGGVAGTDHSSVLSPVDSSVDFRAVGVFVGRIAPLPLPVGDSEDSWEDVLLHSLIDL